MVDENFVKSFRKEIEWDLKSQNDQAKEILDWAQELLEVWADGTRIKLEARQNGDFPEHALIVSGPSGYTGKRASVSYNGAQILVSTGREPLKVYFEEETLRFRVSRRDPETDEVQRVSLDRKEAVWTVFGPSFRESVNKALQAM